MAHAFVDLMNDHNPDAVEGFIDRNAFVDGGREANRAFWAQWFAAFPDTRVTLDDVLVDGDRVAGRFTYRVPSLARSWGWSPPGRRS